MCLLDILTKNLPYLFYKFIQNIPVSRSLLELFRSLSQPQYLLSLALLGFTNFVFIPAFREILIIYGISRMQ